MCSSPPPMRLRITGGGEGQPPEPASLRQRAEEPQKQQPERQREQKQKQKRKQQQQRARGEPLAKQSGNTAAAAADEREEQRRARRGLGSQSVGALTALGAVALYGTARCGISVFHLMRRHYLRQLLHDLADALSTLGVTWWLDFGSLLGVYRDGDLIKHDNDVDVAVLEPDWDALLAGLRALLPQYGARLVIPSDDPTTRFVRVYCPLGMADVFGAQPAGTGRLLVDCGHGSCTEIDRDAVLPTSVLTWRGSKLSVPGNITYALEQRYGPDWRVPRYMDKGADVVEGQKLYARIFRALGSVGIRL